MIGLLLDGYLPPSNFGNPSSPVFAFVEGNGILTMSPRNFAPDYSVGEFQFSFNQDQGTLGFSAVSSVPEPETLCNVTSRVSFARAETPSAKLVY